MGDTLEIGVIIITGFLSVAILSSILLSKIKFPYTIGLVIIGALGAFAAQHIEILSPIRGLELSPDIILFLILPTLVFDAAININVTLLYKNLIPILLLAVVGIVISAGVIGLALPLCTPVSLAGALLFGALISATDPVAVIALFNEIKAPRRLVTLIDGESIFNDATAIVLFSVVSGTAIRQYSDLLCNMLPGLWSFIFVLCGGVITGTLVGLSGSLMLRIEKGNVILQITVSLIMAYISFIIADKIGFSGVISTLTAGVVLNAASGVTIRRRHRESIHHFWEYFAFIANSFVFLLLGFTEFDIFNTPKSIKHSLWLILVAIPIIVAARACVIYILIPLYNKLTKPENKITGAYQAILLWGGLRGAVPVALVLTIPHSFPQREILLHLTFGFILFTLLCQGTTIKKFMEFLGVRPEKNELEDENPVTTMHSFENEYFATLVLKGLLDKFSEEGFFISKEESDEHTPVYTMKKYGIVLLLERREADIIFTHRQEDTDYIRTILYETLLDFSQSLQAIKKVIKPEHVSKLINQTDDLQASKGETIKKEIKRKHSPFLKLLSPDNILPAIRANNKEDVIKELLSFLKEKGDIPDYETALRALFEREKTMTTGIGNGIALPHAKIKAIKNIVAVLGVKKDGLDFDALDKKPVYIIVLILSPVDSPVPHIQFLSFITKVLSSPNIREDIIKANSPKQIYTVIEKYVV